MTEQEFFKAEKNVKDAISLIFELKKKNPSAIEKLVWFLEGMNFAKPS